MLRKSARAQRWLDMTVVPEEEKCLKLADDHIAGFATESRKELLVILLPSARMYGQQAGEAGGHGLVCLTGTLRGAAMSATGAELDGIAGNQTVNDKIGMGPEHGDAVGD